MDQKDFERAEVMVLGCIAQSMSGSDSEQELVIKTVEKYGIRPNWYRDQCHVAFAEAVEKIWKERHQLDAFILMKTIEGPGASETISALIEAPASIANLDYYCAALKNKHIYGAVHKMMMGALKELQPDNIGIQVEDFVRSIHDLQEKLADGDDRLKQLGEYMTESLEKKQRLHQERFVNHNWEYLDGLRWPWKEVDQIFAGLKTGLHILAALASQGKSTMAVNLSVFWNEIGVKHGFFSIDMAADQLADRYPCVVNRVSLARLNFGGSSEDLARFQDGYEKSVKLNNVWISEVDDAKTMEYQCYRGVKTLGWKAIIVDYIQLVHSDDKGQVPEYTRVQHAVQAIKSVAKKLNVPIICLAQLSRAFEQQLREKGFAPGLDAIGDSAEIARAAASVTCLYQDEETRKYWADNPPTQLAYGDRQDASVRHGIVNPREESEDQKKQRQQGQLSLAKAIRPIWFDVKKNQQGRCGKLPFVMFPNYFLFRPGNSEGEKIEVQVDGKTKKLPIQMFEQIRDDWTYAEQDWFLEMTNAMPRRGCKLMGETFVEMEQRMVLEREKHPEVKHFVRRQDGSGYFIEAK